VIKGPLAWGVAKVTAIEAGAAPTYEAMRDELRAQLAKDQAEGAVNDAIQRFEEERSSGKTLEQAAQDAGLMIVVHERVTMQGVDASGAPIQTISEDPTFVQQIFATAGSETTDFTPLKSGGFVLARVDDIIPAGFRPLAEVKAVMVMAWKAQKTSEAVKKVADAMIADVKAGKGFAEAARGRKMPIVVTDGAFTRRTIMQSPAGALAAQLFVAKQGEIVSAPDAQGGAILVAQVTKIEKTDPAGDKQLYDQARAAAANLIETDLLVSLQAAALQAAKVKYNETLRHQTIGYQPDQAEGAQ
jgi:peptidyl-prolyl cis-trans isomerase D